MQDLRQQVTELEAKMQNLLSSISLTDKKTQLNALEAKTLDPALWENPEAAKSLLQEFSDTKQEIEQMETLTQEISLLKELAQDEKTQEGLENEIRKTQSALEKLILKSFLAGKYDKKNALVSIHAGQGGTEAMDWANMLLRMYLRFCQRRDWETHVLDTTAGEEAGEKRETFKVAGAYASGYLKGESGTP